ncbi:hypothetical protein ACHAXR_012070, partial [Thalassiosira sp. AJA248-18]
FFPQPSSYHPSLDTTANQRRLSTNPSIVGERDDCNWQSSEYKVPENNNIEFRKTLIAGFPSGDDKRMISLQMEALAGWRAVKDEWDFANDGMSNHPFINANYPHHEGFWGWSDVADQVVLVLPDMRRSMVECKLNCSQEVPMQEDSHKDHPPVEAMYEWRDLRVMDECRWYGWFIDFWMEGGLLRDMFTHRTITLDQWNDLMSKPFYTREDLTYDQSSDPKDVTPTYDPHCKNGDISNGCEPIEVIAADRLLDPTRGPDEAAKLATTLLKDSTIRQKIVDDHKAWDCMHAKLIQDKKGPKTLNERPDNEVSSEYKFSLEMLNEMLDELNRLITKYSGGDWNAKPTAKRLVELLTEQFFFLQIEANELKSSGAQVLRDKDFLGPRTREVRRRRVRAKEASFGWSAKVNAVPTTIDHHDHFNAIGQSLFKKKHSEANIARERLKAKPKEVSEETILTV